MPNDSSPWRTKEPKERREDEIRCDYKRLINKQMAAVEWKLIPLPTVCSSALRILINFHSRKDLRRVDELVSWQPTKKRHSTFVWMRNINSLCHYIASDKLLLQPSRRERELVQINEQKWFLIRLMFINRNSFPYMCTREIFNYAERQDEPGITEHSAFSSVSVRIIPRIPLSMAAAAAFSTTQFQHCHSSRRFQWHFLSSDSHSLLFLILNHNLLSW